MNRPSIFFTLISLMAGSLACQNSGAFPTPSAQSENTETAPPTLEVVVTTEVTTAPPVITPAIAPAARPAVTAPSEPGAVATPLPLTSTPGPESEGCFAVVWGPTTFRTETAPYTFIDLQIGEKLPVDQVVQFYATRHPEYHVNRGGVWGYIDVTYANLVGSCDNIPYIVITPTATSESPGDAGPTDHVWSIRQLLTHLPILINS